MALINDLRRVVGDADDIISHTHAAQRAVDELRHSTRLNDADRDSILAGLASRLDEVRHLASTISQNIDG